MVEREYRVGDAGEGGEIEDWEEEKMEARCLFL